MIAGFWGLTLEAGKSYTQQVDSTFRISMAALGPKLPKNAADRVSVMISYAGNEFTLCSLTPGKLEQQPLDITFLEGEEITFMTQGSAAMSVDLTGNYVMELDEGDFNDDEEDLMDDEEMMMMAGKGDQEGEEDEEDSEEDEEEWEDEEDAIDEKLMLALSKKMGIPVSADGKITEIEEEDDDDEEDDDETMMMSEESEEESEEEESAPEPKAAPAKENNKAKAAAEEKKKQQQQQQAKAAEAKKQQQEKAKAAAAAKKEEQAKESAEAKAKESNKKEEAKNIKELLNEKKVAEAKKEAETQKESKKKTLPSGLVIEDTKVGNGPRAKNGKKVCVRYIGRLMNGKVFDSNTKGSPFTFRLGGGEVIKGWDLGVQGMNVGGSRTLTIPANLAYGSRGAPPDIPKNATLQFEIKLLEVKG